MSVQFGGLISGLDTNQLISQLTEIERRPVRQLQARREGIQQDLTRISRLSSAMNSLGQAFDTLADPARSTPFAAKSSHPEALSVTATGDATPGTYQVEIVQRAQTALQRSTGFNNESVRAGTLEISVFGEESVTIDIAEGASLEAVRDQINETGLDVQASIINTGTGQFLNITSTRDGAPLPDGSGSPLPAALSIQEVSSGVDGQALGFSTIRAGQNAQISIDELLVERSSNRFSDVIDGVEFNLLQDSQESIEVEIVQDTEAVMENLKKLTDQYNATIAIIKDLSSPGTRQILAAQLRGVFTDQASQLGLTFTRTGDMQIDTSAFDAGRVDPSEILTLVGGTDGLAASMNQTLAAYTSSDGILSINRQSLEDNTRSLDRQIERREKQVENFAVRTRRRFSQLEQALLRMQDSQVSLQNIIPFQSNP